MVTAFDAQPFQAFKECCSHAQCLQGPAAVISHEFEQADGRSHT